MPLYKPLIILAPAVAVLRGDASVSGTVTFEQSSESSPTTISYDIKGSDPSAQRGMHIHQFGDNTNGCTSAGPHCKHFKFLADLCCLKRRTISLEREEIMQVS